MSNRDQISHRLLVMHQVHCELAEQLAQLKGLRKKLRAAERKEAAQVRMIRVRKSIPAETEAYSPL